MTLGDMAKIGVMSAMTNTILKRKATECELASGSDEYIDVNIIGVSLLDGETCVYHNQYDLHDFQHQSEIGGLYEFFVTKAVLEYKEVK